VGESPKDQDLSNIWWFARYAPLAGQNPTGIGAQLGMKHKGVLICVTVFEIAVEQQLSLSAYIRPVINDLSLVNI